MPAPGPRADLTQLLHSVDAGGQRDLDALFAAIYDDLRRLANRHMQAERSDHTLQPTALVHEAYLKLIDQRSTDWRDRLHFFAMASRIIRRILVDHSRGRSAVKRSRGRERLPIDHLVADGRDVHLLALEEALEALSAIDARQAQIVELRFFGGLTVPEVAEYLQMGPRSVDREWRCAKAWLLYRLSGEDGGSSDGP
jgi:RNA polymerase sigma factor (TIGR02999 family)